MKVIVALNILQQTAVEHQDFLTVYDTKIIVASKFIARMWIQDRFRSETGFWVFQNADSSDAVKKPNMESTTFIVQFSPKRSEIAQNLYSPERRKNIISKLLIRFYFPIHIIGRFCENRSQNLLNGVHLAKMDAKVTSLQIPRDVIIVEIMTSRRTGFTG